MGERSKRCKEWEGSSVRCVAMSVGMGSVGDNGGYKAGKCDEGL